MGHKARTDWKGVLENTETGIHSRVQEAGGEASDVGQSVGTVAQELGLDAQTLL